MTNYNSAKSGYWNDPTSWNPVGIPTSIDGVSIASGHSITIDGDCAASILNLSASPGSSTLIWPSNPGGDWTLTIASSMTIYGGGSFLIGTAAAPLVSSRTATVVFSSAAGGSLAVNSNSNGIATFKAYGYPSYHMADSDSQRTLLAALIVAGVGVAFQTSEPVDWQTGDVVWVGIGGDKTVAPTTIEQVSITRIDASNYTATFVYNHAAGDFLISGKRNVVIRGNSLTECLRISTSSYQSSYPYFIADWVHFKWVARGFYFLDYNVTMWSNQNIFSGRLYVKNCLIDSPSATTGGIHLDITSGYADSETCFDQNHFYGPFLEAYQFNNLADGHWKLDNTTCIGVKNFVLSGTAPRCNVSADGLWYCADRTNTSNIIFINTKLQTISNFKFTSAFQVYEPGISSLGSIIIPNNLQTRFEDGIIYHIGDNISYTYPFTFRWYCQDTSMQLLVKNVDWYDIPYWSAIYLQRFHGDVYFDTCTFNGCGTSATLPSQFRGAVRIKQDTSFGRIRFYNCSFGTLAQNKYFNTLLEVSTYAQDWAIQAGSRIIFEKCQVKIPTSFAWTGAASSSWTDTLGWFLQDGGRLLNDWSYRSAWSVNQTLEVIDSEALDAGDVDQWPISYPSVDRLGVVTGGAEIRKETTTVIDNTFALKILPFSCVDRAWATRKVSVRIPVNAGQTVTVKLSLRKNQSQATGRRPMIHLYGLGIDTYSEMSNVINTWEELTVSGIAVIDGVVEFYVSAMNEYDSACAYNPDNFYSPHELGWLTIYADGLSIVVA